MNSKNDENLDLTFITDEKNQTLKERFEVLIKYTRFFDCLVGYFYHQLCCTCELNPSTNMLH